MTKGQIYKIINKITNKIYIGQCVSEYSNGRKHGYLNRFKIHIKSAKTKNDCRALGNAIKQYGEDNFVCELICECEQSEMNTLEDKFIKEYNTLVPNGYNLMSGGCNGRTHSKETKEKMSTTRTGKYHSQETKEKMSESAKGRKLTTETKMIQSAQRKFRDMKESNKIRVLDILKLLNIEKFPAYLVYRYNEPRKSEGFYIAKHPKLPKGKTKHFVSKKLKIEEKYKQAISYLQVVESSP